MRGLKGAHLTNGFCTIAIKINMYWNNIPIWNTIGIGIIDK